MTPVCVFVTMQINAAMLAETAARVQAGELEEDDSAVAGLALAGLTQGVDEDIVGFAPPEPILGPWQDGVAAHSQVRSIGARWLLGELQPEQVTAQVTPLLADLESTLLAADAAVAQAYNLDSAELAEYRLQLVEAMTGLFE